MSARRDPEEDDFRALIARNAPALGRLVRHYEAEPEAQRDLEQEILIALWRARSSFRAESTERTWVYRIAHNVAASHIAKARPKRRHPRLRARLTRSRRSAASYGASMNGSEPSICRRASSCCSRSRAARPRRSPR